MNMTNARVKTGRKWRGALAALIGISMLLIGWSPAGAIGDQPEIGKQYCWGFTSTRLMNDGISTSAGPFPIHLSAGIYDIEIQTQDNHPSPDYQPLQTEEQVYLVLDSGYTSGFTTDIPNDGQWMTTTFTDVSLGETHAMTVRHRQFGEINSLNVIKVCFTLVGYVSPPAVVAPEVEEPTIQPPAVVEPPAVVVEPPAVVEPEPAAPAVTTQVEGVTELALTGTSRSQTLAIAGIGMLILGIALTLLDRKQQTAALG